MSRYTVADVEKWLAGNPDLSIAGTEALPATPKRRNKYNAKPLITPDGVRFDSRAEYLRWIELSQLQAAGEISRLRLKPKFELQPGFTTANGQAFRAITYTADFEYYEDGVRVIEDVKGGDVRTEAFILRWKMLAFHLRNENVRLNVHSV